MPSDNSISGNGNDESAKMNKDLKNWLRESSSDLPFDKSYSEYGDKKPSGNCQICRKQKATDVCLKCGKSVCNSHYYHIIGVCEKCLSKDTVEKWKKHNPDWKKLLGVDWLD